MASQTPVNEQITDAVTQTNTKDIAEAPAMAMGSIYQALAQATGILFENAVSAQQQQNVLMQAAANQGVIQIYSADTQAGGGAEQLQDQLLQSKAELHAASVGGVNSQVVDSVKLSLRSVLDSAGDFSFSVRSAAEAMQAMLDGISTASHHDGMRTLQLAATAACLRAMIADPGQADAYIKVLNEIRRLT
ncbi:RebB family R body protein [Marinobacterium sedimentorum]|uniref:RebB family R body protein n=1 Tax=Marinobacterium sedimentorum TaxID=2927804 RepID=UPI0020C644C7|nr:RebB family R body protein [Marinobacterium sedimentorum]MCP8687307.1 RebB family R body protein [Marinobacterium sedimentorum]